VAAATFVGYSGYVRAGVLFGDPPGGWTYLYGASPGEAQTGPPDGTQGFTALDGTWSHENGSDEWDLSTIGAGSVGGVTGDLSDGATTYIRLQDPGDPTDFAMPDPSNRKILFLHNITAEGASDSILDDGVSISFRARLATTGVLDAIHPDGGGAMSPVPATGDGYVLHDGGKGSFQIKQNASSVAGEGVISFSLATPSDTTNVTQPSLVMNNLNGTANSGAVDNGEGTAANALAIADPTTWREFYITISRGGAGTHQVSVYADGSTTPDVFDVTAGTGDDSNGMSYIAFGAGATPQSGAIDVDFFGWAPGVTPPVPAGLPADFNDDDMVDLIDFGILRDHFQQAVTSFGEGDANRDGFVDFRDFRVWKSNRTDVDGAAATVPEPWAGTLALVASIACAAVARLQGEHGRRRR
jgi:hypothetical protein